MVSPSSSRSRLLSLLACFVLFAAACASDEPDVGAADDDTAAEATTTAVESDESDEADEAEEPDEEVEEEAEEAATTTEVEDSDPLEGLEGFDAVDAFAEQFVADAGLEGASLIVVHRDDGVIHQTQYGAFEEGRISLIASSSKMISAGVLLSLQEQGLLDIEAPVSGQTDWSPGADITPAQLVSNSSGLVGLGPDLLYTPYFCQWTPTSSLDDCSTAVLETEADDADVVAPESEFRYGGAQWQVAGGVAEAVSGRTWAELIDETYVEPCGVDSLGYLNLGQVVSVAGYPTVFGGDPSLHDASENPTIEGGAHITPADYGTLLLMHLRGGQCEGGQVLSQESLDTMHADRMASLGLDAGPGTGYGMGWWVDRETGIISDGGAWGTLPWLNLEDGYGAYWVIEDENSTTAGISEELISLVHVAVTGEEL